VFSCFREVFVSMMATCISFRAIHPMLGVGVRLRGFAASARLARIHMRR
jgi:hypothetical protein